MVKPIKLLILCSGEHQEIFHFDCNQKLIESKSEVKEKVTRVIKYFNNDPNKNSKKIEMPKDKNVDEKIFEESIICHHNAIADYIKNNYLNDINLLLKST